MGHCCHKYGSEFGDKMQMHHMKCMGLAFLGLTMLAHACLFKVIYAVGVKHLCMKKAKIKKLHVEHLKVDNLEILNKKETSG